MRTIIEHLYKKVVWANESERRTPKKRENLRNKPSCDGTEQKGCFLTKIGNMRHEKTIK